jgi:spore germination cell wall hydrolase CwlJ-like protein
MRQVMRAAVLGAAGVVALATAPLRAETGEDAHALALKANVQSLLPRAVLMAPIPDETTRKSIATTGLATMAPIPDAGAGEIAEPRDPLELERSARNCLAKAIYFEARGESAKGQRAVAEVVVTRTRVRGRTVCGVVYEGSWRSTGCQFSFACDGIRDVVRDGPAWTRAKRIANLVLSGRGKRVAKGATHYHADSILPYWAPSMRKLKKIGSHVFYRE